MKTIKRLPHAGALVIAVIIFSLAGSESSAVDQLTLSHVSTMEMAVGTHRPEIRVRADGGLIVVVVEPGPGANETGRIKHQAYRFDADLQQEGEPFPVAAIDATYGEPADHRAMLVGDELVVVYQALNYGEDKPVGGGGPSEDFATDQSLMMARFDMQGNELMRGEDGIAWRCLLIVRCQMSVMMVMRSVKATAESCGTMCLGIVIVMRGAEIFLLMRFITIQSEAYC